jgi:acyl carrier protein
MSKNELKELFTECRFNTDHDFENMESLGEIGLDSLDIMMLSYELSEKSGSEIKLQVSSTIGEILEMA